MNVSSVIAALLLVSVCVHEMKFWRTTIIKTHKTKFEIIVMCIGLLVLIGFVLVFGRKWYHYLLFGCTVLFVIADVWKQGLSEDGLLIAARGKELFKWDEIYNAKLFMTNQVKIVYYTKQHSIIATQYYSVEDYDHIIELLRKNNVTYLVE